MAKKLPAFLKKKGAKKAPKSGVKKVSAKNAFKANQFKKGGGRAGSGGY